MALKPEELRYSETHEWVNITSEGSNKLATIGITKFAVEQLSNVVFMELPEVGQRVEVEEEFGEVESVKAVSPLYSPVQGEIVAVNKEIAKNLEILDSDPYNAGWLIKVRLTSDVGLSKLLDYTKYEQQCAQEG